MNVLQNNYARLAGFAAFVAALTVFAAYAAEGTNGFAPDVENNDAYRNNAIVGLNSSTSFLRFANMRSGEPVRNYVEVYSIDRGRALGRFELDVPAKASIQLNYLEMISAAGLYYTDVADQDLALYVQNGRDKQLWQHVQYDAVAGSLVNASVCAAAPHVDYVPAQNVAINVHTSSIQRSHSLLTIHNFADVDGSFDANVYDAKDGKLIGTVPLRLPARGSFNESARWFEEQLGFTPTRDQYHMNIELVPTSIPHAKVVVGHAVFNPVTGSGGNLSNPCAINGGIISLPYPT